MQPIKERQLITYVRSKYHRLFIADCGSRSESKSKMLQRLVELHYNSKSQQEINALNSYYEDMTEEQRKKPNKL